MEILICDGNWIEQGGSFACSGTLQAVTYQPNGNPAITPEDARELLNHSMVLFAVVFGALAIKKALS